MRSNGWVVTTGPGEKKKTGSKEDTGDLQPGRGVSTTVKPSGGGAAEKVREERIPEKDTERRVERQPTNEMGREADLIHLRACEKAPKMQRLNESREGGVGGASQGDVGKGEARR